MLDGETASKRTNSLNSLHRHTSQRQPAYYGAIARETHRLTTSRLALSKIMSRSHQKTTEEAWVTEAKTRIRHGQEDVLRLLDTSEREK